MGDLPQCGFLALFLFVKKPDHKYRNGQTYNVSLWSRDMLVPHSMCLSEPPLRDPPRA